MTFQGQRKSHTL